MLNEHWQQRRCYKPLMQIAIPKGRGVSSSFYKNVVLKKIAKKNEKSTSKNKYIQKSVSNMPIYNMIVLQPTNPPLKSEKVSNPAPWDFFPLSETENTYLVGVTNHVCFWHSIPTYSRLSYNPMIVEYTLRLQKFSNTPRIYKVQPYVFIICENDFSTFSPYKCTGKQILPYHKKSQRTT